jgi:hypothetical protein
MSMFPPHVHLLGHAMQSHLAWLAEVLDRPFPDQAFDRIASIPGPITTEHRLGVFIGHLAVFAEVVGRLTPEVIDREDCPDSVVDLTGSDLERRLSALVGDYTEALGLATVGNTVNLKLAAVMRDNLVVIAHWMARVIKAIGQPWDFLEGVLTGHPTTIALNTRFSCPETLTELSGWPTGTEPYDREAVQDALSESLMLSVALGQDFGRLAPSTVLVPSRKKSGSSGGLLWGLALGWLLGDWFRSDCDD